MPRKPGPKKKRKPKTQKLSLRQEVFMEEFAKMGFDWNKRKLAVLRAGYEPVNALLTANQVIRKVTNNDRMIAAMTRKGINFSKLAEKLQALLNAEQVVKVQHDGTLIKSPDNFVQHKAFETAARLYDTFPSQKIDIDQHSVTEIVLSPEIIGRIQKAKEMETIDLERIEGEFRRRPE